MRNTLETVRMVVKSTGKMAEINVGRRNVIITGANGCGKTQLLESMYEYLLKRVVQKGYASETTLTNNITNFSRMLEGMTKADINYQSYSSILKNAESDLMMLQFPPVTVPDWDKMIIDYQEGRAIVAWFKAVREARIRPASSSRNINAIRDDLRGAGDAEIFFEEYLVNQKTTQAYAESQEIGNDPGVAASISSWFEKLQEDLRHLFEDPNLRLDFKYKEQVFFIVQEGKQPFRFQELSSGFSSLLTIYASLMMKFKFSDTAIDDLYGVVIIDEIDAHLHVSIQRKILAFLIKSFPGVQFIVSTHSPFVVSSVSDAVIYDLGKLEQVDDLSMFSYDSILEGLFNVEPVSEVLLEKISELTDLMESKDTDFEKLGRLVREIAQFENVLDVQSAYFVKRARLMLNKGLRGPSDV